MAQQTAKHERAGPSPSKSPLNLKPKSVNFIQEKARETGVPYQKMIRRIVDFYADRDRKAALHEPLWHP